MGHRTKSDRSVQHPQTLRYDDRVDPFTTTREAKEFLIAQIVDEAAREGTPLTDIERRMLYFTETAWMPEDTWQANEIFDRDYDQTAYERRIAQLSTNLKKRPEHDAQQWKQALRILGKEDHYLLILIDRALLNLIDSALQQTPAQQGTLPWRVKYILWGLGIGSLIVLTMLVVHVFQEVLPQ